MFLLLRCLQTWKLFEEGRALEIMDPSVSTWDRNEAALCIQVALLCCQAAVSVRPEMHGVRLMLSSDSFSLPKPGRPGTRGREGRWTTAASSTLTGTSANSTAASTGTDATKSSSIFYGIAEDFSRNSISPLLFDPTDSILLAGDPIRLFRHFLKRHGSSATEARPPEVIYRCPKRVRHTESPSRSSRYVTFGADAASDSTHRLGSGTVVIINIRDRRGWRQGTEPRRLTIPVVAPRPITAPVPPMFHPLGFRILEAGAREWRTATFLALPLAYGFAFA
ncbi:hypothetical protein BHE74_00023412 [Ensete ventricosum]|nr:hypothetical protein BHE74_00023412 [Ensete ventricosum]